VAACILPGAGFGEHRLWVCVQRGQSRDTELEFVDLRSCHRTLECRVAILTPAKTSVTPFLQ